MKGRKEVSGVELQIKHSSWKPLLQKFAFGGGGARFDPMLEEK